MLVKFLDGTSREVAVQSFADLIGANLRSADLIGADLRSANLRSADLIGADLRSADLRSADLCSADLCRANLRSANLRSANLRSANLRSANLTDAALTDANLTDANLTDAALIGANLRGANLRGADLTDAKGLVQFQVCPEVGAFIAFKKVDGKVITLLVPEGAKRVNAYGSRKCRAEFAYVMSPEAAGLEAHGGFKYPSSGIVTPDSFDPDPRIECSHGIHFFMTRAEAEEY